jgi:hypothetical protein
MIVKYAVRSITQMNMNMAASSKNLLAVLQNREEEENDIQKLKQEDKDKPYTIKELVLPEEYLLQQPNGALPGTTNNSTSAVGRLSEAPILTLPDPLTLPPPTLDTPQNTTAT